MNLENDLHTLQNIVPSKKLAYRIESLAGNLPARHAGFNGSLLAFRVVLAALVLFLLSGMGTGVLLAAKGSSQGSVLYPIRQTLEKHNVPFFVQPSTPTPTEAPTVSPTVGVEKNESEKKSREATDSAGKSIHHTIQGVGDDEENERENEKELENTILIPTQQVKGLHIGPRKEDDK